VPVFARGRGRSDPTPAGRRVLEFAAGVVTRYDQLTSELRAPEPLRGTLRLVTSTAPATIMADLLAGFRRSYPDVRFDIDIADSAAVNRALVEDRAHIGFCGSPSQDRRLHQVAIAADEIVFIVPRSHPAAVIGWLTLDELQNEQFVRREPGSGTQATVSDSLAAHGVDVDRLACPVTVGTADAVVDAVRAGLGIGAVSRTALTHSDGVMDVTVQGVDLTRSLSIVWRETAHQSELVKRFIDHVQGSAPTPPG